MKTLFAMIFAPTVSAPDFNIGSISSSLKRIHPFIVKGFACLALASFAFAQEKIPSPKPQPHPEASYHADWRWVQGAVFVPTNCVNEAQQWDQYDPVINDRELHYASLYGINCVRVYLHYFIYLKKKEVFLNDIEDFLERANKYGIKVEFVFFDDCWNEPSTAILREDYKYPAPLFGVHNSQWLLSPGHNLLGDHYEENRDRLKSYVQDVVRAHLNDHRIAFWETYNEPKRKTKGIVPLMRDAQQWIHETGSKIPVTATGGEFIGNPYSDFFTWHNYEASYKFKSDPETLNTECMCRKNQTVSGIVNAFKGKVGFIMWEFGIGRDDCRFYWGETAEKPAKKEHETPFHGIVFADGHPWSTKDVKSLLGPVAYAKLPVYKVKYYRDSSFDDLAKESITPAIDFDLPDEVGYGSPDTTVEINKDHYSIRWTGTVQPSQTGDCLFSIRSDGDVKVTLGGKQILQTSAGAKRASTIKVALDSKIPTPIIVEYVHSPGPASIHLMWTQPGSTSQPVFPVSHP